MEITEILSRFQEVSEQPDGGYLARCSGHNDSRPSLRIWVGKDAKVRMTCRAGCDTGDVIKAVGLRWPDMFGATGEGLTVRAKRADVIGILEIARLRTYIDDTSVLLADSGDHTANVAIKYLADRFGVRPLEAARLGLGVDSPDHYWIDLEYLSRTYTRYPRVTVPLYGFDGVARGLQGRDISGLCEARWVSLSNPDGLRWAPYGVLTASEPTDVYLVTEGPGDGLTAVSAGFNAVLVRGASLTNNPELVAELAAGLRGKRVIVAGDNDKAGKKFTEQVAAGLKPEGVQVETLTLPRRIADLADWRAAVGDFPAALSKAVSESVPVPTKSNKSRDRRMSAFLAAMEG